MLHLLLLEIQTVLRKPGISNFNENESERENYSPNKVKDSELFYDLTSIPISGLL